MPFNDKLVRQAIVYCINQTNQKNNDPLKNYVLNEMSRKDILSVYWLGKVLTEDRLEVPEWALVPLHLLAGGALTAAVGSGLSKVMGGKLASSKNAELLAGFGITYGASLAAQAVYFMYKRATDACTLKCRKVVRPGKNYPFQVAVCFHQCKVQSLQGLIMKLRSETQLCQQSKYPEKCIHAINSQIIKYQTELEKEAYQLQKSKSALMTRLRVIPAAMSSRPSTEKL